MGSGISINLRAVLSTLGILLLFLGGALLLPMLVALYYREPQWWTFAVVAVGSAAIGALFWMRRSSEMKAEIRIREGFLIVASAWLVLSLAGCLPFVLGGVLDSFTDAFFETMSGFSTTGATILGGAGNPQIEDLPKAFLFWRSLAHWMGGMGIIVLTLAILPLLGVGGMQLYKAEVPGPSADKLTPRVQETARRLWMIYVGITFVQVLLLLPAMGLFDAVNHAFATMATGGFSTLNGSVGQFGSAYAEWIIILFMFLAGMNFALHYRMLRGRPITVFKDTELRVYTGIIVIASLLVTAGVWLPTMSLFGGGDFAGYDSFFGALRRGMFQSVSIVTTTGFGTVDYELWPVLSVGVLFLAFFVGGMGGSTGGGIKVIRHVLMFKNSHKELKQLIHPQAIIPIRLGDRVVTQDVLRNVLSFIVLYLGLIGFGTLAMSVLGLDLLSAFGATLSCIGNIGPAFGSMGPAENYAHVPMLGKWVLAMLMMAGRLEIFTVVVVLLPAFWRR